jgi:tight adherence protein B
MTVLLIGGIVCATLALVALTLVVLGPAPARVPEERRLRAGQTPASALAGTAARMAGAIERGLIRRGSAARLAATLEQAGLSVRPADFLILVGMGVLAAGAVGSVLGGVMLAVLLAALVPIVAKLVLGLRAGKRRAAFADQLDDSLQLISSSLRAGHSLLRALDTVSHEAEEPTAAEFARIVNETRVGRDLGDALDETSARMRSEDFGWVSQAIAIHREVGGDLAEVLATVCSTIRERNQIRRQVKALSAEGKLSAAVLMALPFGVTGFLAVSNPTYILKFTQSMVGWGLLVAAGVLLFVGGLWLRKVVTFKY